MIGRLIEYHDWAGLRETGGLAPTEHEVAVPFDDGTCAWCGVLIGGYLREDPETGYERGAYTLMYRVEEAELVALGRTNAGAEYICEDCAAGE